MAYELDARAHFAELMSRPEADIELDRVALAISQAEYEQLDPAPYLRRLDDMSAELRPRLSPEESAERLVAELNAYLFGEQAFYGNAADYYDPRNSYLNEVLDRRTGIPISLALVYIELGRRVGLPIEGVGMPGHFIVRCASQASSLLIDPFDHGAVLSLAECAARVHQIYGNRLQFAPELLRPATRREIVTRMLANLKGCYLRRGDLRRALRAVEWSVIADPSLFDSLREQALIRFRLGDFRAAANDLEQYLKLQPSGSLADQTRAQLRQIEELWVRRN